MPQTHDKPLSWYRNRISNVVERFKRGEREVRIAEVEGISRERVRQIVNEQLGVARYSAERSWAERRLRGEAETYRLPERSPRVIAALRLVARLREEQKVLDRQDDAA
jgi:hypothetical protein